MPGQVLFRGSAVALVTPFRDGKVDVPAIERLVHFQVENGTAAIIACGTTGEPTTMTMEERETVVRTVVRAVENRVPVVAGTGSNCTQTVIDTANRYRDIGCAAQLVVTPYYNKTTPEGLYRHFMEIAENTELPIMIYNVPSRTAMDISFEVLERLMACEKFIAVKESSYDVPGILMKTACMDRAALYSGNDDMVVPLMALGAQGVISVAANALPKQMAGMVNSYLCGDHAAALAWQVRLMPVIRALFAEVSPIPCKAAMEMMGLCGGELRLPLVPAGNAVREQLKAALTALEVPLS